MKVKDIKHSIQCCFGSIGTCRECLMFDTPEKDCQTRLIKITIEKLDELVNLLDDKVNHHYYDTLEELQEENIKMREKLDSILNIIEKD